MSRTLNGSPVLQHFKHGNAIEIYNKKMFDFYPGLPHIQFVYQMSPHMEIKIS